MAQTITGTETFARFGLLELQVRAMLREAAEISPADLERISKGLREPHYIEQIVVHGLYPRGTIGAEMRLSIDWRVHRLMLNSGGDAVQVPSSWSDGVAPSISEGVRTFLLACTENGLGREWKVIYARSFDREKVNGILGFVHCETRSWERTPGKATLGLGPLREASLVVSLAV